MTQRRRPFVLDPPRPGVDQVDGILLLDVDGVLNRLGGTADRGHLPTVKVDGNRRIPMDMIDDQVVDELDRCLGQTARVGWLTTWGFRVARLESLLGGRLAGGFVVSERPSGVTVSDQWKYDAASRLRAAWPDARFAWAEDESIPPPLRRGTGSSLWADDLLVVPRSETGLTLDDARRTTAHLRLR